MGVKRAVDTEFWKDSKVDEFTPEDKYFMLYLLTNPSTTQLGIYELSIKQAAYHLGYSKEAVRVLIDRFQKAYGVIFYSEETSEIAIKNFLRHSIVKGGFRRHIADIRKDLCLVADDILPEDTGLAGGRADQAQQGPDRGGFSRAVRSDESKKFTLRDRKIQLHHTTVFPVIFGKLTCFDNVHILTLSLVD